MHKRVLSRLFVGALMTATPIAFAEPPPAKTSAPAAPDAPHADSLGTTPRLLAAPPQPEKKYSEAELAHRSRVVTTFDGAAGSGSGKITVGDLEDAVAAAGTFTQQRFLDQATLKGLLDRSLRFELLAAEAARRGYDKNTSVANSVKQNSVQAMLKQEIDTRVTPQSVSADAVKKYYDEHIEEFVRPEMRRASLIQLPSEADAKAMLEQATAADMRSFRELARLRSSDDVSKLRGGDLRYFDVKGKPDEEGSNVDPLLTKAAFALKTVGDTSGIIKTDAGYSIVRVTGLRAAHSETVKDADERIRMRLWREQREAAIDAMLAELKREQPVETHPELLDAIVLVADAPTPPNAGLPAGFPHTKPPQVPFPKE
jgi:peptidyl-prolyl cis-trans isomerase C